MEATDENLADSCALAKELFKPSETSVSMANRERLLTEFDDAIVNLKRLIECVATTWQAISRSLRRSG
jgi:hypothetical protein